MHTLVTLDLLDPPDQRIKTAAGWTSTTKLLKGYLHVVPRLLLSLPQDATDAWTTIKSFESRIEFPLSLPVTAEAYNRALFEKNLAASRG